MSLTTNPTSSLGANATSRLGEDSASTLDSALSKSQLSTSAFLTMFTTQLKYQDPSNPMESYELASQLAQFSSVEKLTEVNSNIVKLQSYLSSINNAQMIETIGKQVIGLSSAIQLREGTASPLAYQLAEPATGSVKVSIYDSQNKLVRTIELGAQAAGRYDIGWDGKDNEGKKLQDGDYTARVEARSDQGALSDVTTLATGSIYSVRFGKGTATMVLDGPNGITMTAGDIVEVLNGTSNPDGA